MQVFVVRKAAMGTPITASEYREENVLISVLAEVRSREGRINSGGNTKRFALVLENLFQGGEFFSCILSSNFRTVFLFCPVGNL